MCPILARMALIWIFLGTAPVFAAQGESEEGWFEFSPSDVTNQKSAITFGLGTQKINLTGSIIFPGEYDDNSSSNISPYLAGRSLGNHRIGATYGGDVTYAFKFIDNLPLLNVGAGLYLGATGDVYAGYSSSTYVVENKKAELIPAASIGLIYPPEPVLEFRFGIEYHTVRGLGIFLTIGGD